MAAYSACMLEVSVEGALTLPVVLLGALVFALCKTPGHGKGIIMGPPSPIIGPPPTGKAGTSTGRPDASATMVMSGMGTDVDAGMKLPLASCSDAASAGYAASAALYAC